MNQSARLFFCCLNFFSMLDACYLHARSGSNMSFHQNENFLYPAGKIPSADSLITLRGKVMDALTGEPISYANIQVAEKPFGTISNEEGDFTFTFLSTNSKHL